MNESVNRVRDILAALIKAALISDDHQGLPFRKAAGTGLAELREDPPNPAELRMDGAWTLAIQMAESPDLQPLEGRVNLTLPRQSPFTLDELLSPGFDRDAAIEQIRKSASTG